MTSLAPSSYRHPYPTPPTSHSDTELDSPLLDYPVSPTDPTMDHDQIIHIQTLPQDGECGVGVSRQASNSSFFNNVFLDAPSMDKGNTRPLKLKKRIEKEWSAPVGPARIRRRSIHSLPKSPISPHMISYLNIPPSPRYLVRDNSTSSSAHRNITSSFLALDSPCLTSSPIPPPPLPKISSAPQSRSSSGSSAIHLGLGKFQTYDPTILPGPSPPTSPPLTPIEKQLPKSPITPTSLPVPSKAAKLLGTNSPNPSSLKMSSGPKTLSSFIRSAASTGSPLKRNKNFRPLPNSTLVDIERFFGDVPRQPSNPKKGSSKTREGRAGTTSASMALQAQDKALPSTRGKGEYDVEGRMWMDVEEEQEFAWLMSDLTSDLAPKQRAKIDKAAGIVEGEWGMEDFKCVLDMKKVDIPKSKVSVEKKKKGEKGRKVHESFLDFGMGEESVSEIIIPAEFTKRSISNPIPIKIISPTPTKPTLPSKSIPPIPRSVSAPHHHPYPVFAPSSSLPSLSSSPPSPPGGSPPDRPKHRPPPLDLRFLPPPRNMPIVMVTQSSARPVSGSGSLPSLMPHTPLKGGHGKSGSVDSPIRIGGWRDAPLDLPLDMGGRDSLVVVSLGQKEPKTPFNHPRRAPIAPSSLPPLPSLPISTKTYIPPVPIRPKRSDDIPIPLRHMAAVDKAEGKEREGPQDAVKDYVKWYAAKKEEYERNISYFDPPSPTLPVAKGKIGGGWFKKVIKL